MVSKYLLWVQSVFLTTAWVVCGGIAWHVAHGKRSTLMHHQGCSGRILYNLKILQKGVKGLCVRRHGKFSQGNLFNLLSLIS